MSILNTAKEKAASLEDLKAKWELLIGRINESRNRQVFTLPGFEAYGWARLEEFLSRLEDAINTPLLEQARNILSETKIDVTQKTVDQLKKGLSVRREGLIEILKAVGLELREMPVDKVALKCNYDLKGFLEEGKWDGLVQRARDWKNLGTALEPLFKNMNDKTLLYNGLFERALEEGPATELLRRLAEVENRAFQIGGERLRERLRFEGIENPLSPLGIVDSSLTSVAEKKEDIRKLQGEEIEVEELVKEEDTSLKMLLKELEARYNEIRKSFTLEEQKAEILVRKYNDLANILRKLPKTILEDANSKQLRQLCVELDNQIKNLEEELTKSFSDDARIFIDSLIEGKLPEDWAPKRVVMVLRELLDKRLAFKMSWRD